MKVFRASSHPRRIFLVRSTFLKFFIDNFWNYLLCNMVMFGIKMTAIKFPIEWWDLISKISRFEFLANFFIIFTHIFGHRDLDLWPKVTKFNRVRVSVISNHLAKTASISVHPFGLNFVHKNSGHTDTQTDRQTDRHTHTDTLKWKYNPSTISLRC